MSVQILVGDARERLSDIPDGSVQCCVTSPPYFGLRDYGVDGQIGLEATPAEFVAAMVGLFRDVRRVLRDDGTLWLNLGDSYASAPGQASRGGPPSASSTLQGNGHRGGGPKLAKLPRVGKSGNQGIGAGNPARRPFDPALKPKDLIGIPWRVAFALQADGWWLRQDIIWHKMNPMPEPVKDRCTKAHEYVFLLSKSERYFFNAEAIEEMAECPQGPGNTKSYEVDGERDGANANLGGSIHKIGKRERRRKRSVWSLTSEPYPGAHFATFPTKLVEPCILAGSLPGSTVLDPFGGAGTTGMVAERLGRDALLIELNPEYADLARARLRAAFCQVQSEAPEKAHDLGGLFAA